MSAIHSEECIGKMTQNKDRNFQIGQAQISEEEDGVSWKQNKKNKQKDQKICETKTNKTKHDETSICTQIRLKQTNNEE